jgi:hypothetical protein
VLAGLVACLDGCGTMVAAADTVGTVAVGAVGLAADAAIGTVKVAGKVVGKATDAVLDDSAAPAH